MSFRNNKTSSTTTSCVLNFTDGRDAWSKTVSAFVLSRKGIAGSVVLSIITMGSWPFWWPDSLRNINVRIETILFVFSLSFVVIVLGGLSYLKKRTERSLDIKYMLHQFAHDMRDYHSLLFRHLKEVHKNKNRDFREEYSNHLQSIANHIRDLYKRLTGNDSIDVCIRLAYPIKGENDNVEYVTRVRTSGLRQNREDTTDPIPANKGIPRYLIEKQCHEILIYNDIDEAARLNLFLKTRNEENYPNDIKTMIVCPMNAFDGVRCSMIGILYITTRDTNVFKEEHVDYSRFVADTAANSVSIATAMYRIINSFSKKGGRSV